MKNTVFENDIILFELKDGILYGKYKVVKIDLEVAMAATEFRQKIVGNQVFPSIADISLVKQIPKETRAYFSSVQAGEDLSALAVIIDNPVTRMMGNFFLKFHHPKYPFRFFTSQQEAMSWISRFVNEDCLCS